MGAGGGGEHRLTFIVVSGPLFEEGVEGYGLRLSGPKIAFRKNQCYRCVRGGESHMDEEGCWLQSHVRLSRVTRKILSVHGIFTHV